MAQGPFARSSIELEQVRFVESSDLRNQGILGIWIGQKTADAEKDFPDVECGTPLVFQDVEADASLTIDVGMKDAGAERDLGRAEGIVGREGDSQREESSCVGTSVGTDNGGVPAVEIVRVRGTRGAARNWLCLEILEFFGNSACGHWKRELVGLDNPF